MAVQYYHKFIRDDVIVNFLEMLQNYILITFIISYYFWFFSLLYICSFLRLKLSILWGCEMFHTRVCLWKIGSCMFLASSLQLSSFRPYWKLNFGFSDDLGSSSYLLWKYFYEIDKNWILGLENIKVIITAHKKTNTLKVTFHVY